MQKRLIHRLPSLYKGAIILLIGLLASCTVSQQRDTGTLPPARGGKGEIVLVMDSVKWLGPLGDAVREVFQEPIYGLPQPEPIFSITFVTASEFKSILQHSRNVIMVTTFDSNSAETQRLQRNFTPESKELVLKGGERFMHQKKDEFATGQLLLHLFSEKEETLIQKLRSNKKALQDIFQTRETIAIQQKLLDNKVLNHELANAIANSHGLNIKLPIGYQVAKDTTGFMWLRFAELQVDKSLIIAHKPYESEEAFSDKAIIEWRNALGKQYLYEDKERNPDAYMMTEDKVPVAFKEIELAGTYAKEARGLWRIKGIFLGGGFAGYTFANPAKGEIYYVEGLLIAPGTKKREHMRELEIIINAIQFAK